MHTKLYSDHMLPIEKTTIPDTVAIPCPFMSFKNRLAIRCLDCKHFNGVAKMSDSGEWHQKYTIRCTHPIERRVIDIEVISE